MKVTIDGIEIDVPKGTTILQAARMIGPEVAPPAMCYYTKLKTIKFILCLDSSTNL